MQVQTIWRFLTNRTMNQSGQSHQQMATQSSSIWNRGDWCPRLSTSSCERARQVERERVKKRFRSRDEKKMNLTTKPSKFFWCHVSSVEIWLRLSWETECCLMSALFTFRQRQQATKENIRWSCLTPDDETQHSITLDNKLQHQTTKHFIEQQQVNTGNVGWQQATPGNNRVWQNLVSTFVAFGNLWLCSVTLCYLRNLTKHNSMWTQVNSGNKT